MGRPRTPLLLSADEEATLRRWTRAGTTEQRLAQRAKTILLAAEGLPWKAVCRQTGLSLENSLKWQRRFRHERLDGLRDRPRPGPPRRISPERKTAVIALACTTPPDGSRRWSIRKLAKASQVSTATVQRILSAGQLKPHKTTYWCGKSPDPEFAAKQAAILGLYLDPPDNALVLAVDEKSHIQALERTQLELPMQPGRPRRLTATYRRHGTTCLLAALAVHEGSIEGRCRQRHTHREFLAFLKYLYRRHPRLKLHVICDNFSPHKHKNVRAWVAKRRRLTLHFTPTYASWLNQIEIWFNILSRELLKDAVWHSKQELVAAILTYIKRYNERAKPFKWTYTGDPLAA